MEPQPKYLVPRPRTCSNLSFSCNLADGVLLCPDPELPFPKAGLSRLQDALSRLRVPVYLKHRSPEKGGCPFVFRLDPKIGKPQGYHLTVSPRRVLVTGTDEAGLFYGLCTLAQWIFLHGFANPNPPTKLRGIHIEDWPEFLNRGVMLDISRDKVPKLRTILDLVDFLSGLKINQLQLYTEHTFAYRGHSKVWRRYSPLTGQNVRALDSYCQARHVALVPNQNSLGHFHRWLVHEPYRRLAECPEGIDHAFSLQKEPFSLCPTDPEAAMLLEDLYGQLLPNFKSGSFNVGLDETFDLGKGRSAGACESRGKSRVYLDFLKNVREMAARHGKRIQFWGDIVLAQPDLIGEIPKDVTALAWGYEADHPFDRECLAFSESGLEFYVCPGTSSWFSIGGRSDNAVANLANAARAGARHQATGYLITDWGDFGHLQPLPVSYLGFLAGAALSWDPETEAPLQQELTNWLDLYAFGDRAGIMGRFARDLGNIYQKAGPPTKNGSPLFFLLRYPQEPMSHERLAGLTLENLDQTANRLDELAPLLALPQIPEKGGKLAVKELAWALSFLRWLCDYGKARLKAGDRAAVFPIPGEQAVPLARRLEALIAEHRINWRARNRSGGLADSCAKLERILRLLG